MWLPRTLHVHRNGAPPGLRPASVLCLRRLGSWAVANPGGMEVHTRQLARDLGLGDTLSHNSRIAKTLSRLCQFDLAHWVSGDLAVRTVVAPLPERQLARLSPELVRLHNWMVQRQVLQERSRSVSSSAASSEAERSVERGTIL